MEVDFTYTEAQALSLRYHLDHPEYSLYFEAGIGSGKSNILCKMAILYGLQYPDKLFAISARDLNQFKSAILPELERILIDDMGLGPDDYLINRSSGNVTLPGGGSIVARSAEAYDSHFRSISLAGIFMDEVDFIREEAYMAAKGRIRVSPEVFMCFSSPYGYNYIYDIYHGHDFEEVEAGVFISHTLKRIRVHAPTWSNNFLNQNYIDELYRSYSPNAFSQEVAAERLALNSGAVYNEFSRSKHVKPCRDIYQPGMELVFSLDYNIADFCLNVSVLHEGKVYTLDEITLHFKNVREMGHAIIDKCRSNGWSLNDVVIIGDGAGNNRKDVLATMTAYETFRELGLTTRRAYKPTVERRVNISNGALYHNKVVIDPCCKVLIKDLEQVVWDSKGKIDKTNLKLTHASDAHSYMLWAALEPPKSSKGGTAW